MPAAEFPRCSHEQLPGVRLKISDYLVPAEFVNGLATGMYQALLRLDISYSNQVLADLLQMLVFKALRVGDLRLSGARWAPK